VPLGRVVLNSPPRVQGLRRRFIFHTFRTNYFQPYITCMLLE
jgi:hypothetical protein